jgi:hypothetical protein
MQLKQVKIRGFRSIKDQIVRFNNRFQILVGINESGKTNVLRALRLIDERFPPIAQDQRISLPTEAADLTQSVDFEFEMSALEAKTYTETSLKAFLVKDPIATPIGVRDGKTLSVREFVELHNIPLVWANLKTKKRHVYGYAHHLERVAEGWYQRPEGVAGITVALNDKSSAAIDNFKYIYAPDFPELSVETLKPLGADQPSAHCNSELRAILESKIPACVYWTYEDRFLLPANVLIDEFSSDPDTCIPLREMFRLADIHDVKKEISSAAARGNNHLRNLLERVADRATTHIRGIWKEYKSISIKLELNGSGIDASIVDHFNRYNFADRSDGFKRFVSFLLVISARARTNSLRNTLILVDEAEIGLHPSGVKYLREELKRIAENNYVVVSTHSTFMIDRETIGRHLIVKKTKEITEITPVDSTNIVDEEVVFNALNHSVFDVLKPMNFLFEGWRDLRLFEVAIAKRGSDVKDEAHRLGEVGRCFLQGVNDAGRVVPILELASRQYVVVSDSDEAAQQAQKKFKGSGVWRTYENLGANKRTYLTSEDFVVAEAFKKPLAALAKKYGGAELILDDSTARKPRVPQIRAWMQGHCKLEGDLLKEAIDEVKEQVFNNLKISQIVPQYFEVMRKLADDVKVTPST